MSRDGQATYYDVGGIETADVVKAKLTGEQYIGFLLGTSLVYQCRLNWKGQPADDARKAANYAKWLAEELQEVRQVPASGVELIAAERREQIEKHGFDAAHDDAWWNETGQLLDAAGHLLSYGRHEYPASWNKSWQAKFAKKSRVEQLVVAGALIAAEIDRLKRKEDVPQSAKEDAA